MAKETSLEMYRRLRAERNTSALSSDLTQSNSTLNMYKTLRKQRDSESLYNDINTINPSLQSAINSWQNAETMASTKTSLQNTLNRMNSYKKAYGGDMDEAYSKSFDDTISSYQELFDNWDSLSNRYSVASSAEEYDSLVNPKQKKSTFDVEYKKLMDNPDFEENSAVKDRYAFIKNADEASMASAKNFEAMNEDELKVYRYLYNTQGIDAAENFFNRINGDLEKRVTENYANEQMGKYKDANFWETILPTLKSIGLKTVGAMGAYLSDTNSMIMDGSVDVYSPYHTLYNMGEDTEKALMQNMNSFTQFMYGTGNSILNSTLNRLLSDVGIVNMGMQSYSSTVRQFIEAGASEEQAYMAATVAGVFEAFFENISWTKLKKYDELLKSESIVGWKSILKEVAKQMIAEGEEEFSTDFANNLVDIIAGQMGGYSNLKNTYTQKRLEGLTEKQALWNTIFETLGDMGLSFLGGAISGGVFAGADTAFRYFTNRNTGKSYKQYGDVNELKSIATDLGLNDAAERLNDPTNAKVGATINEIKQHVYESNENADVKDYSALARVYDSGITHSAYSIDLDKNVTVNGLKLENGSIVAETSDGDIKLSNLVSYNVNLDDGDIHNKKAFVENYKGGNIGKYYFAFDRAYNYGKLGYTVTDADSWVKENIADGTISSETITSIYSEGMKDSTSKSEKKLAKMKETYEGIAKEGNVDTSIFSYGKKDVEGKVNFNKLTDNQKANIAIISAIAKVAGIKVRFTNTGKYNGYYNISKNEIVIDIKATQYGNEKVNNAMLTAFSHEVTHWMKNKAPTDYRNLQNAILEKLSEDYGVESTLIVQAEMERLFERDNVAESERNDKADEYRDVAIDELVARACEDMMSNSSYVNDVLSNLTQKEQISLAKKILEFIKKVKAAIKDFLGRFDSESPEANAIRSSYEYFEKAQALWEKAFERARENASLQYENGSDANSIYSDKNLEENAKAHFGITDKFNLAGYMLTDGTMLDFSGQHWLEGWSKSDIEKWKKQNDIRQVDHEDIFEIFLEDNNTGDNRLKFMKRGNIRMSPEGSGINLLENVEPSKEQYAKLKEFIRDYCLPTYNKFYIDIEGKGIEKVVYVGKISAERIINDIKNYYKSGIVPKGNEGSLSSFYSDKIDKKDSFAERLINQKGGFTYDDDGNVVLSKSETSAKDIADGLKTGILDLVGQTVTIKSDNRVCVFGDGIPNNKHSNNALKAIVETAYNGKWSKNIEAKHAEDAYNGWYSYTVKFGVPRTDGKNAYTDYYEGALKIKVGKDNVSRIYDIVRVQKTDSNNKILKSDKIDSDGNKLTNAQAEYFKDSKARDKSGNLRVLFHGTTKEFYTFDNSFSNVEGDMGKGFYFTSNESDVHENYANEEGPDLKNKITQKVERIISDLEYDSEGLEEYEGLSEEEIYYKVRDEFVTSEPIALECYLDIKNPCYVGSKQTYLFEDVLDGRTEDDFDDSDEYYEALDEAAEEIIGEIENALYDYGYDAYVGKVTDIISEAINDDGISLENLKQELSGQYIEDESGQMASNEVARIIVEALGYDGIIDDTVSKKFKGMHLASDTTHYIVFSSQQIKLTSNQNPTTNPDIRYSEKLDAEYLALAKDEIRNFERLDKMVEEEAKRNGYKHLMFHETNARNIHVFDINMGTHGGTDSETPYGIFTKSSPNNIGLGDHQMSLYVKSDKRLTVSNREEVKVKIPALVPYYNEIAKIDKKYSELNEELVMDEMNAFDEWSDAHPDADMDEIYPTSYIFEDKPANIDYEKYLKAFKIRKDTFKEWEDKYAEIAIKCKEVITSYLRDNGYDSMYFVVDGGSGGRQTDSLIVLDSNQVKSAEAVTYDDNGYIIPLSERFNSKSNDIRYSDKLDSELYSYKGKPIWSGAVDLTDGKIIESHSYNEAEKADFHHSLYFTPEVAEKIDDEEYGFFYIGNGKVQGEWRTSLDDGIIKKIQHQLTLNTNMLYSEIMTDSNLVSTLHPESDQVNTSEDADRILKEYEQLKKNQTKQIKSLEDENARLKRILEIQKELANEVIIDETALRNYAEEISKDYNISKKDTESIYNALNRYYKSMLTDKEWSMDEFRKDMLHLADVIIGLSPKTDIDTYSAEMRDKLKSYFKGVKLKLNENQKRDLESASGTNWHKALFGRINTANEGQQLDQFYTEMIETFPEIANYELSSGVLAKDVTDADEAVALWEIVNNFYEDKTIAWTKEMTSEARQSLADSIVDHFRMVSDAQSLGEKYDAKIKNMQAEYNRKLSQAKSRLKNADNKALAKEYDAEIENVRKEMQNKVSEMEANKAKLIAELEEYKNNAEKKASDLLYEQKKELQKRFNEQYKRRILSQQIFYKSKRLAKLLKNDKDNYCPDILKEPLRDFLKSMDFTVAENTYWDVNYNLRVLQAFSNLSKKLVDIQKAKESLSDEYFDFSDELIENLNNIHGLMDAIIKKSARPDINVIRKLDSERLGLLNETLTAFYKSIYKAKDALREERLAATRKYGESTYRHLTMLEDSKAHKKIVSNLLGWLHWENVLPAYVFDRFGEGGKAMFKEMMEADNKLAFNSKKAKDDIAKMFTPEEANEWLTETHKCEVGGKKFLMTTAQIMNLYCLSKRDAAEQHLHTVVKNPGKADEITIEGQGIVVGEINGKQIQTGKIKVEKSDVKRITDNLTKTQKKVADMMQSYLSNECSMWGNYVSMHRFGMLQFTEENYFPMKPYVEGNAEPKEQTESTKIFALLNRGFTKALNDKASNALIINDIFSVFAQHVQDMATLNAYGIPVLDMYNWLSYKETYKDDNGEKHNLSSMREQMDRVYGTRAFKWMKRYLEDLNGNVYNSYDIDYIPKWLMKHYKASRVGANLRVAIMQPCSIVRATALIDGKYIRKAMTLRPSELKAIEERRNTHSGISVWKEELGQFDNAVSREIMKDVVNTKTKFRRGYEKAIEYSMMPAEIGDKVTWDILYRAWEIEISEKHPNLNEEAYNKAVADRFSDIVHRTQVVNSINTRTALMKSKNALHQMITAFMAEPSVSYSMLEAQYFSYMMDARTMGRKQAFIKHKDAIMKTALTFLLNSLAVSVMAAIFDTLRNRDDDEAFAESYMKNILDNMIDETTSLLPYFKELNGIRTGFTSSRMDLAVTDEIIKAVQTLSNSKWNYKDVKAIVQLASTASGIPGANFMREFVTIWDNLMDAMGYESSKINK